MPYMEEKVCGGALRNLFLKRKCMRQGFHVYEVTFVPDETAMAGNV
jgi:hypothetical protein